MRIDDLGVVTVRAHRLDFGVALVGGGPAGLAVLLSAHKSGRLTELLERGLLLIERNATIGRGQIGNYVINSDSTGATFVDPLRVGSESSLHELLNTPVATRIAAAGADAVPLSEVGELMDLVGVAVQKIIRQYPKSAVLTSCAADCGKRLHDGRWKLHVSGESGRSYDVCADQIVLATGGAQPKAKLLQDVVAGASIIPRWGSKLLQSGDVLSHGGPHRVTRLLRNVQHPRVAILGGSTSAMAVAHMLLHRVPDIAWSEGAVTVFHRRPLRVYYTSAQEAIADGYTEFDDGDLCPKTLRVYRLAGLRLDSRELLMRVRGIGGRAPEARLRLHMLQPEDPEALHRIDDSDLVIAALGYRPNALQLSDENGEKIPLFAHSGSSAPLVDDQCRVLDDCGSAIPGVFGIGLAAGFVPQGRLGGEPSFSGQANGLWLWQNDIGSMIVASLLSDAFRSPAGSLGRETAAGATA